MIDVSKYTAHLHPGKFEGETPATEYYYELMLDGDGETYTPNGADDAEMPSAELFHVDAAEAEIFDLPIGAWFLLWENGDGFVFGRVFNERWSAELFFNEWCGLE